MTSRQASGDAVAPVALDTTAAAGGKGSWGALAAAFGACALVFVALDAVWLTLTATRLYRPALGHVMREDFDVAAAAAFYVIYLAGVVGFAVRPSASTLGAWVRGACFGFVAYATYDLTNQATLRGWPWHVTMADLAWGTFVTSTSAAAAFLALAAARPAVRRRVPRRH